MKKITHYFSCLLLTALIANAAYAQDNGYPRPLTDKTVSDNLSKDWGQRNPGAQNTPTQWFELGDGFYGTYNTGEVPHMTFYNRDGAYVQTYKRGEWSSVPSTVKSSYDRSTYKNQEVTGYWESADPLKKDYYLELKDDKGKASRVWVNEKGELSPAFPKVKPTAKKIN